MPAPRTYPVIVNSVAGNGHSAEALDAIRAAFDAVGAVADIRDARSGEQVAELAERAVKERHEVIVAGGGDGTVSTVAGAMAGSGLALGVLPLGTLNHFAKDLALPLAMEEAVRVIVAGHLAEVDVGEVNGRVFINNSSIGLYPTLVAVRERQRRRLGRSKWHALFWATLTVLKRHPMLDVSLTLDGATERRRTPLVFVGNNDYRIEGFSLGTRERLDAGVLSIYLTRRHGRWRLLGLAARALVGRLHDSRDFEALTGQSITVATRHRALRVATDGEVVTMKTPLAYRVRPRALRVVVPAPASP
ncbi:MAG: diacylglycerol/lipid kinase family protein [Usitatibacter sp.]